MNRPIVSGIYSIEAAHCIRCGSCSTLAPENFQLDDVAAHLVRQPRDEAESRRCEAARLNCPAGAILLERDGLERRRRAVDEDDEPWHP